jgi:DNA ligase (NAD+)
VDEIGTRIASSVLAYFDDPDHREQIERLRSAGLRMEMDAPAEPSGQVLEGKRFVISGVFHLHSRDELKALILQNGGKHAASISSKTDYVLAGENMGPSKYDKAQQLGVPIIGEEDFLNMLK